MKNIIFLFALMLISLISCSLFYPETGLYFSSFEEIENFIDNEIKYIKDIDKHGVDDFWQYPWDTLESKSGDCEDKALLFLYLAYENFNIKGELVCGYISSTKTHHASVLICGKEFLNIENQIFIDSSSYDESFFCCDTFNL